MVGLVYICHRVSGDGFSLTTFTCGPGVPGPFLEVIGPVDSFFRTSCRIHDAGGALGSLTGSHESPVLLDDLCEALELGAHARPVSIEHRHLVALVEERLNAGSAQGCTLVPGCQTLPNRIQRR